MKTPLKDSDYYQVKYLDAKGELNEIKERLALAEKAANILLDLYEGGDIICTDNFGCLTDQTVDEAINLLREIMKR